LEAAMLATLDALAIALYVQIDDFLPVRSGPGHPPKITDSRRPTRWVTGGC
jgi:hypothetical protein